MKNVPFALMFAMPVFMLVCGCGSGSGADSGKEKNGVISAYRETVREQDVIIHALGGDAVDGTEYTYINSVDVLKKWYEKGFRVFEVDVYETSDGALVLSHRSGTDGSLTKADCARLGLEYPASPTYDEFMQCKVHEVYNPSSFADFVAFCKMYGGGYYMIDIQNRSYEDTKRIYQKIYDIAHGDPAVLDHLIAGGWTSSMIRACKDVYDFPLLNLYWTKQADREFVRENDFVVYCKSAGVTSFSTDKSRFSERNRPSLLARNLISYVFYTDDIGTASGILSLGASCVGMNFPPSADDEF